MDTKLVGQGFIITRREAGPFKGTGYEVRYLNEVGQEVTSPVWFRLEGPDFNLELDQEIAHGAIEVKLRSDLTDGLEGKEEAFFLEFHPHTGSIFSIVRKLTDDTTQESEYVDFTSLALDVHQPITAFFFIEEGSLVDCTLYGVDVIVP